MTSTTLSTLPILSSLTAPPPALPPASSSRFPPPHGVALLASSPAPTRLLRLAALANCTALSQGLLLDLGVNPTFRQYISAASELLPRLRTCYPRHHRRSRYAAVGCATLTAPRHHHAAFHPSQCLHLYTATLSDPLGPTISRFLDCSLTFLDVHRLCCRRRRRQPIIAIRLCSPSAP